jgi:hypothetical protein
MPDCHEALVEAILWRRLDLPGHEVCRLWAHGAGWKLSGTAVFSYQERPCKLDYQVLCTRDWHTQGARITGFAGTRDVDLEVAVDQNRTWYLNQEPCQTVTGCVDIDLGFTPATNLLPIRRLSLAVGQQAQVRAAWLPFPSLEFEVLPQAYKNEGQQIYRYESGSGKFVRQLQVSASGLVTEYEGLWMIESLIAFRST